MSNFVLPRNMKNIVRSNYSYTIIWKKLGKIQPKWSISIFCVLKWWKHCFLIMKCYFNNHLMWWYQSLITIPSTMFLQYADLFELSTALIPRLFSHKDCGCQCRANNIVNSGFTTNSHFVRASHKPDKTPARSFALLTHRLVRFQLTSPLACIIAQLYRASPFLLQHMQVCTNNATST